MKKLRFTICITGVLFALIIPIGASMLPFGMPIKVKSNMGEAGSVTAEINASKVMFKDCGECVGECIGHEFDADDITLTVNKAEFNLFDKYIVKTEPPTEPVKTFPYKFTATDIFGNAVTEKSLSGKQIYFVHLWATWCPPCVAEMPDFAKLVQDYGDRVGFLGLVVDYDSNLKGAVNLVKSNNIPNSFVMINASEPTARAIYNLVKSGYYPTTVILDSEGNILGGQLIGALGSKYGTHLAKYLK